MIRQRKKEISGPRMNSKGRESEREKRGSKGNLLSLSFERVEAMHRVYEPWPREDLLIKTIKRWSLAAACREGEEAKSTEYRNQLYSPFVQRSSVGFSKIRPFGQFWWGAERISADGKHEISETHLNNNKMERPAPLLVVSVLFHALCQLLVSERLHGATTYLSHISLHKNNSINHSLIITFLTLSHTFFSQISILTVQRKCSYRSQTQLIISSSQLLASASCVDRLLKMEYWNVKDPFTELNSGAHKGFP